MSAEIVQFSGLTRLDVSVDSVLDGAREATLSEAVIIGVDTEGELFLASSVGEIAVTLKHVQVALADLTERARDGYTRRGA